MAFDNVKKALKMLRAIISGKIDENAQVTDEERQFMERIVSSGRKMNKQERQRLFEIVGRFEKKAEA